MDDQHIAAYISLGSNTGDACDMLQRYLAILEKLPNLHSIKTSPLYMTEPQGFEQQPWFANQVIKVRVDAIFWTATKFLDALLTIEKKLGRRRSANPRLRYGPRCIDADLLLFGEIKSDFASCLIPHPRMLNRAFVLVPLADLEPGMLIKSLGIGAWLEKLEYRVVGNKIYQKG